MKVDIADLDAGRHDIVVEADNIGTCNVRETLIDGLTVVINECDRQIETRMEILVRPPSNYHRGDSTVLRPKPFTNFHDSAANVCVDFQSTGARKPHIYEALRHP
jgi:hypothetical protein